MRTYTLTVEGRSFKIAVKQFSPKEAKLEVNGDAYTVRIDDVVSDNGPRPGRTAPKAAPSPGRSQASTAAPPKATPAGAGSVTAPIPGLVLAVLVKEGQEVKSGQALLKMEAMKMETVVSAPSDGTVQSIAVASGDSVTQGQPLMVVG